MTRPLGMLAATIALAGCGGPAPQADPDVARVLAEHETAGGDRADEGDGSEFDFGPILAQGQTLGHTFTLTNRSDRPIHVLGATAMTPCCSAVGLLPPGPIAPGGSASIPVVLRPGFQAGPKRAEFEIQTDSTVHPVARFALDASLFAALEVQSLDNSPVSLPAGRPRSQTLRVTCRRKGGLGLGAPEAVEAPPPLTAAFVGTPAEAATAEGIIEATRDITLTIPASNEPGSYRAAIVLCWAGGRREEHVIGWGVVPAIRATPSGLVLRRDVGPSQHSIVLQSDDRDFRILDVAGPLVAGEVEKSATANRSHRVRVRLDPSRCEGRGVVDLNLTTDHPARPTVTVTILVLPSNGETSR